MSIDARNMKAFNQALSEYTQYNRRELGPLLENRANRMRWELYRQFRDIAPERSALDAELEALGGRVKRREVNGKRLTLAQEKRKRRGSVKYLSAGFMLRTWRAQREGQNVRRDMRDRQNRKIGEVIDRTARGVARPSVELVNLLEGAAKQNAQRGLVNRALAKQTADMRRYIIRKQQQQQARTISQLAVFTKGLNL